MSTQSVQSPDPTADDRSTDAAPTAHVQVTGRNVEIPDHFRVYVGQKLSRPNGSTTRSTGSTSNSHENNRRQRRNCQRVEITAHVDRGPVVRGEGPRRHLLRRLRGRGSQT